jgi:hypothetical protein
MNRTILERARCMLSNAGLWDKHNLWAETVATACYLINRSLNSAIDFKIPEEVWSGKPVDYSNLRIFGCPAYAHVNNGKLVPRAQKCTFVGYGSGVKGYRLLCADSKKVIVSRDVTFDESAFSSLGDASSSGFSSTPTPETTVEDLEIDLPVNVDPAITSSTNSIDSGASTTQSDSAFAPPIIHNHSIAQDRARRNIVLPPRYRDMAHYAFIAAQDIIDATEPSSYSEAISCDNSSKWLIAMNDEFESLQRNSTWDLVELPAGKRPLKCKWIYKKDDISGVEPTRWKARLVVKGFEQRESIDFNEVFSPVVRHSSIRVMLAIVALFDLELEQLDVKTAFLHGDLDEEIYMTQPKGFFAPGQEHLVCHLKKSLYGLKQAPRQWYKRFDSFMLAQNYS